ncbi:MAG: rhamnulokinase family protein [Lysinibacillus sp.]
MVTVLAYDLGASNGRLTAQSFDGERLMLKEVHRFINEPLKKGNHFYWDYTNLIHELQKGLKLAEGLQAQSIGIDTWGVDFGCIDEAGAIIQNPYSYRDTQSLPFVNRIQDKISHYELYQRTGIEISSINTLFQLMAIEHHNGQLLKNCHRILLMPNLLLYALSGVALNELTIASTTQLVQLEIKNWDQSLIQKVFTNELKLAPIGETHKVVGALTQYPHIKVVLVPGHDTACALSALPIDEPSSIFISLGTWGLIGMELERPVVTKEAFERGFTNEGTSEKTIRFQKNATGFWILQKLRSEWKNNGVTLTYEQESQAFNETKPFQAIINPVADAFFNPSNMENAITEFCKTTNQVVPLTKGEFIRCFTESLALYYATVIDEIEETTGKKANTVFIGGGGTQNELLCQQIANACGKQVVVGPVEASSIGNGLSQLRALGEIANVAQGREIVKASFEVKQYEPQQVEIWHAMKEKYNFLF